MHMRPEDEKVLHQVLKAYEEERGQEYITLAFPKSWWWRSYYHHLTDVRVVFCTVDTVSVRVEYRRCLLLKYDVQLCAS